MFSVPLSSDLMRQQQMVDSLCASFSQQTLLIETHISWVLLTGEYAYKIKKSLNLGFLDFSTLALRYFYCLEELRLNRRLAPELYLEVVSIGGSDKQPALGGEPVLDYAVKMRRFETTCMMDQLVEQGRINAYHLDKLAAMLVAFHASLPHAYEDSPYYSITHIQQATLKNFELMPSLLEDHADRDKLESVRQTHERELAACEDLFRQRAASGFIRECHGDLHLGNIVLIDDTPVPFDGIEFNENLRWIDVISEIAFTMMDLLVRGQTALAWGFLNAYLEGGGDYAGVGVLRFYLAYRAMVRAKISALRASQEKSGEAENEMIACRRYLNFAQESLAPRRGGLIITHGLPGCGKSTFAQNVVERLGAIRIRSDVERKRLFGLSALDSSHSSSGYQGGFDIYSAEATRQTYARLEELVRILLDAGMIVLVDAAFLRRSERTNFQHLAGKMAVPFAIVSILADENLMVERLEARKRRGQDASEADVAVLRVLQAVQEPLGEDENAVFFTNNGREEKFQSNDASWALLEARLTE